MVVVKLLEVVEGEVVVFTIAAVSVSVIMIKESAFMFAERPITLHCNSAAST